MNEEFDDLYCAYQTTLEMVEDRGFFVSKTLKQQSKQDFKEKQSQNQEQGMIFIFEHQEEQKKILVYFIKTIQNITTQDITNFAQKIREKGIFNGVIISNKVLASNAEKLIREINIDDNYHLEYFNIDDLLVNISKHDLVPKHIIVGEEEKKQVLKKYRVKESQLPKILYRDPMARYLGLRKGQLVKILRKSETAGQYIVYRIVAQLIQNYLFTHPISSSKSSTSSSLS